MTPTMSRDECLERIRELAVDGRPPRQRDAGAPDHAAKRHFGSWAAAVEAAGFLRPAKLGTKRAGGPRTSAILNQAERAAYGLTATIRDLESGRIEVHHRAGMPMAALEAFMVELDERSEDEGADWRLLAYSTPNTIYADLLVSREGAPARGRQGVEAYVLARVGHLDRIDPSLERPWSTRRKRVGAGGAGGDFWSEGGFER